MQGWLAWVAGMGGLQGWLAGVAGRGGWQGWLACMGTSCELRETATVYNTMLYNYTVNICMLALTLNRKRLRCHVLSIYLPT